MNYTVGALAHRGVVVLGGGDGAAVGAMMEKGGTEGMMIGVRGEVVSLRWELRRCVRLEAGRRRRLGFPFDARGVSNFRRYSNTGWCTADSGDRARLIIWFRLVTFRFVSTTVTRVNHLLRLRSVFSNALVWTAI